MLTLLPLSTLRVPVELSFWPTPMEPFVFQTELLLRVTVAVEPLPWAMTPTAGMADVVLTVLPLVIRTLPCDPAALAMNNTELVSVALSTVTCPVVPVEAPRTSQLLTDTAPPF